MADLCHNYNLSSGLLILCQFPAHIWVAMSTCSCWHRSKRHYENSRPIYLNHNQTTARITVQGGLLLIRLCAVFLCCHKSSQGRYITNSRKLLWGFWIRGFFFLHEACFAVSKFLILSFVPSSHFLLWLVLSPWYDVQISATQF
jgi:hypothetical protein